MIDDPLSLYCVIANGGVATPPGPVRELSGRRAPLYFAVANCCVQFPQNRLESEKVMDIVCYPRDVFGSSATRSSLITILLLHPVF